jgi:thioredoxin 1
MKIWNIYAWLAMGLLLGGVALPGCDRQSSTSKAADSSPSSAQKAGLPRLLDLGAESCIPCKMMKPVLAELKNEFQGKMQVDFIDVWKNPAEANSYGVQSIPTQIFYNASGKELFRHEGFFSKAEILGKWKELGVSF